MLLLANTSLPGSNRLLVAQTTAGKTRKIIGVILPTGSLGIC